jgi:hypothetical protein
MRLAWCAVLMTAVWTLGCSGGGPALPVNGIVTIDDKPLDGATVTFYGETGAGGFARTGTDGKFVITGMKGQDGLPPGSYKVTVSKMNAADGSEIDPSDPAVGAVTEVDVKNDLPPVYSDPSQTILKYSVTGDGKPIEIKLESKPAKKK